MYACRILKASLSRRKSCIFKWKKCALSKKVRNNFELYRKGWKNYNWLWDNLCQFKNIFQYIHCVYPDVHCSTERRSSVLKSTFQLVFKTCKNLLLPTSQACGKEFSKLWGWETNIFWTRGKTGKNWWF